MEDEYVVYADVLYTALVSIKREYVNEYERISNYKPISTNFCVNIQYNLFKQTVYTNEITAMTPSTITLKLFLMQTTIPAFHSDMKVVLHKYQYEDIQKFSHNKIPIGAWTNINT